MTQTTILALQSMGFGNEKSMTLSLSFSLDVEHNYDHKSLENPNL